MKKYSLALGGGASRGIAHIGVIKFLEENNIKIEEVSGTSMGAIIGAGLAMGMNSKEMQEIFKKINFLKLIDLNFSDSLVSGNKVYNQLKEIYSDKLIEDCKIPLKIVATNIDNGEKIVFTKGKIVDAVRASISLPSIFKSFESEDGKKLVDGGLKANLPLLELSGENIIAVSATRDYEKIKTHRRFWGFSFKRLFFGKTTQIIKKTISIAMMTNEDLSVEIAKLKGKNVFFIKPDLGKFEFYDFKKFDKIIESGYIFCKENLKLEDFGEK